VSLDELPPLDGVPPRARDLLHSLDTAAGVRRLGWAIVAIAVVGVALLIGRGGSRPRDPYLVNQSGRPTAKIAGFGEAAVTVTTSTGLQRLCVAVADTEQQREQGLMGRGDLGGYDAMVFRFPADTDVRFYMRNTPLPLSIAWYDGGGRFVSATDMAPCPDQPDCPTYAAAAPYRLAFEVPRGGLGALGLTGGSTVSVGGACG
jgi:uncharacterized membrane protein (UPF0127 family)